MQILVAAGIKTREEARADLGLAPAAGAPPVAKRGVQHALLGKFNPHHDERGQFAAADNAAGPVGSPTRKPRRTPVQVASNDAMMSDAGPSVLAQAEGEEDEEPRPDENSENGIIEYFDPDTGRIVPYPATAIPPQGWVDMRSLRDPSKPTYFEPQGGRPKVKTPRPRPPAHPAFRHRGPRIILPITSIQQTRMKMLNSGRPAARRLRMMIFLVNIFGSIGTILTPIPRTNTKN